MPDRSGLTFATVRDYYRRLAGQVWRDFLLSLRITITPAVMVVVIIFVYQLWTGHFTSSAAAKADLWTNIRPYVIFLAVFVIFHTLRAAPLLDQARHHDHLRAGDEIANHKASIDELAERIDFLEAKRPLVIPSGEFAKAKRGWNFQYSSRSPVQNIPAKDGYVEGLYLTNVSDEPAFDISIASVGLTAMRAEFGRLNSLTYDDKAVRVSIRYVERDEDGMFGVAGLWHLAQVNRPDFAPLPATGTIMPLHITYRDRHGKEYVDDSYCLHTTYGAESNDVRVTVESLPATA